MLCLHVVIQNFANLHFSALCTDTILRAIKDLTELGK